MNRIAFLALILGPMIAAPRIAFAQKVRQPPPESRKPAAPPAPAETPASTERPSQPGDERAFSPFGDTSKFTRLGGWGGIGGTMGQFGFGSSMLIMAPAVQEELGLSDEQKEALRDWSLEMRDQGREMTRDLREQGENAFRQMDVAGLMQLMGQVNTIMQQNEQGIARILTRKQWTRLRQISLQMEGITALTRPDVIQSLVLAPEQLEEIHEILAQSQFRQLGYWMQQGLAMRQRFGEERGRRTTAKPEPGAEDPASPPEPADRTPPESTTRNDDGKTGSEFAGTRQDGPPDADRRREFRAQFESMRDGADRLHQETVDRLLKVLTRRQRAKFEKLLGPPFDPDALTRGWNPRRGEDAAASEPAAASVPRASERN